MAEVTQSSSAPIVATQTFPSLIERYYTQRFAIDVSGPGEDLYVYTHTNSILVLGLAPSHPIVQKQLTVTEVKFESDTRDLSKNVVRGAKKKGGARLRPDGQLAVITCKEQETPFLIKCPITASLLEVNAQLSTKPELLTQMPATQGYLAVFQPPVSDKNPAENLLSLQDYQQLRFPKT